MNSPTTAQLIANTFSTCSLNPDKTLSKPVDLAAAQTLKILLTATNGKKARKPHQAFLTLTDPATGLEESYPFAVKDNGKAKVDLVCKWSVASSRFPAHT